MNISEIDRNINETEIKLAAILKSLEQIRSAFRTSILDFSVNWIKKEMEYYLITKNPEKAKKLGSSGISVLKDEFQKLQQGLPKIVDVIIDDNKQWPHRKEFIHKMPISQGFYMTPDFVPTIIRLIVNHLGPILKKYDLIKYEQHGAWELSGTDPFYTHGFNLSPEIKRNIEDYDIHAREYFKTQESLDGLKENRAQEEARTLWEKG